MKTNNHQTSPLRPRLRPAALLFALALGLGIFPALAAPPYMEVGGRVVVEAEHFATNTAAANGKYWHIVPDQDNPAANLPNFIHTLTTAHGGKYMMVLPDNNQNHTTTANWGEGPWLDFVVRISTPGTYRLWLRWRGWDGATDSIYAQILGLSDGIGAGPINDWYNYFGNSGTGFNGQWRGSAVPEVVNAAGTLVNASWEITTPGDYTIRITYREDGCSVDKVCLQLESLPNPTDAGPPESPILQDTPFIWSRTPAAGATAIFPTTAYQVQIRDGGLVALSATDPIFQLNGGALAFTKSKTGVITTLDAASPGLLPSGSTNTLTLIYQDANAVSYTNTWQFVASTPVAVPASYKMAAGQVNTAAPGFLANIHQAVTYDTNLGSVVYNVTFANSQDRAEGQLRGYFTDPATGLPYTNNFGTGTGLFPVSYVWGDGPDDTYALPETWLNFDITPFLGGAADTGNFQYDANAPDGNGSVDVYFPGYGPRFDTLNTFNIAGEFTAYLDLPAGLSRLGVNSDDGFIVSCGKNPRERYDASKVIVLGRFDGGRGSSDTLFDIMVEEAGLYPIRVLWYQGNGGADMEFFSVKPDGTKVLINNIASTPRLGDPASIRAYRSTVTPLQLSAVVDLLQPAPNAQGVATNTALQVQLGDSATATVNQGSIHLYLNGVEVTPVKTVSAPRTVLNYTPAGFAEGSTNTARIEFADSLGNSITQSWTFVTAITVAGPAQGELVRKLWLGVTGTTVASLTAWADFINNANYNPNGEPGILNTFEQAQFPGTVDNYGQQFLGYIRPAVTDWYTFYLGSDDNSVLRLGTNDQPSSLRQIAVQAGYNGNREFVSARNTYARRSVPIHLEAGQRYFFEALQKEGGGGDNFAVAWWRSNTPPIVNGSAPISGPVLERFVGAAYSLHPQPVTTTKGNPVNLSAAAYIGLGTVSYQWYKGAGTVPGANALTLSIDPSAVSDSGTYKLRITVDGVNYDSNEALVTVLDDNIAPTVVGPGVGMNDAVLATAGGPGYTVAINFNEAISAASAQSATITVSGGNTVTERNVGGTGNRVLLLKVSAALPANFTVTLSGLTDVAGNSIAAATVVNSGLNSHTPMILGTPGADPVDVAGTAAYGLGDNDFIVVANGHDLWDSADGGHFLYTQRTGNFDAQVRVESLTQANVWSKAGIMAREDLTPGSRNNMILATPLPANNLYNHQWRDVADAASGSKPDPRPTGVSYPDAWVRLTRQGNTFSAYIKTNGVDWVLINDYIPPTAYPDQIYVGLATTSHDNIPGDLTTAVYRDFEISSLVVVAPPQIQSTGIGTDGNIVLNFSAPLSQTYTVLASTNIAQPLNQWSIVAQGTVTASPVTVSDLNSTNYPARFYLIRTP